MSIRRVAIVFDDQLRPDTTGVYCRRALETLAEVEHFRPSELAGIPRGAFDLVLHVDDGLDYRIPPGVGPAAWWAIDTHLDPGRYLAHAGDYDLVFAAQRDGAEMLRRSGANATWLPLACDPGVHRRHDVPEQFDACFVGNLFPGPRTDLVRTLERRFPNTFIGQRFFDEMARTYSASRTVFNRSLLGDVNMRVFEAAACGSLLLTNDLSENGQAEIFRDGVHLATYRDAGEMLDKVEFYLPRAELRRQIASRGVEAAVGRHTYRHRMETILKYAEDLLSQTTVAMGEGWDDTGLKASKITSIARPIRSRSEVIPDSHSNLRTAGSSINGPRPFAIKLDGADGGLLLIRKSEAHQWVT